MSRLRAVADRALAAPVGIADPTKTYDDLVLLTRDRALTVVEVPTISLAYLSDAGIIAAHAAATSALLPLRERRVTFRSMQSPTDVAANALRLDGRARLQGQPEPAWGQHLVAMQDRHEQAAPNRKRVFAEIDLGERSWRTALKPSVAGRERAHWAAAARSVRGRLAASGLGTIDVDSSTLRAMRRRALVRGPLGLVTSTGRHRWDDDEIRDEFADVDLVLGPNWVRTTSSASDRYVATFCVSAYPETVRFPTEMRRPWLATLDAIEGFTVDTDLIFDLVPPSKAADDLMAQRQYATDQRDDAGRGDDLDLDTVDMLDMTKAWAQRLRTDRLPVAYGWARIRVDADSPADLAEMYAEVRHQMDGAGGTGIDVAWPGGKAQVDLLAEGVPGMPVRYTAWKKRMFLPMATAAMPHVGSTLGHAVGSYRGYTTGVEQRGAVLVDLHHAITRPDDDERHVERPPGIALLGAQGSGKTTALLEMVYEATMQGQPVVALNPSSPWEEFAAMPHWTPGRIATLDLLGAGGGIVDPLGPVLIPMPEGADEATRRAVQRERARLADETFGILAHKQCTDPKVEVALMEAIERVVVREDSCSRVLIEDLQAQGTDEARVLATALRFRTGASESDALLGEGAQQVSMTATTRIISMKGMAQQMPRAGKPMADWLPSEALAAATFACAAHLAWRLLATSTAATLKVFAADEVHVLMATDSGRRVVEGLLRVGRAHGTVAVLATHNDRDLADETIRAAIAQWFLFRTDNEAEARASNAAAGLEDSREMAQVRKTLRNGECIAVLDNGTRGRMRWDRDWIAGLSGAATTTPGQRPQEVPA